MVDLRIEDSLMFMTIVSTIRWASSGLTMPLRRAFSLFTGSRIVRVGTKSRLMFVSYWMRLAGSSLRMKSTTWETVLGSPSKRSTTGRKSFSDMMYLCCGSVKGTGADSL